MLLHSCSEDDALIRELKKRRWLRFSIIAMLILVMFAAVVATTLIKAAYPVPVDLEYHPLMANAAGWWGDYGAIGPNGKPPFRYGNSDTNVTYWDENRDGAVEKREDYRNGSSVVSLDTDGDGYFDREIWTRGFTITRRIRVAVPAVTKDDWLLY